MTVTGARGSSRFKVASLLLAMIALAILARPEPAAAVIGGEADGNAHPYVGAVGPLRLSIHPTGVLISPTVVLTAGHVAERRLGPGQARVTFDPVVGSSSTWYTGTAYVDPAYDPRNESDPGDLGVIVLDTAVSGITPASLPTEGLLDQIGPQALTGSTFEVVGYGFSRFLDGSDAHGAPRPDLSSGGTRRVMEEGFASLTTAWSRFVMHEGGATCSGDSGSPNLFAGTDLIAGITTRTDCRNVNWAMRVDTPAHRAFIGQYVALP